MRLIKFLCFNCMSAGKLTGFELYLGDFSDAELKIKYCFLKVIWGFGNRKSYCQLNLT